MKEKTKDTILQVILLVIGHVILATTYKTVPYFYSLCVESQTSYMAKLYMFPLVVVLIVSLLTLFVDYLFVRDVVLVKLGLRDE